MSAFLWSAKPLSDDVRAARDRLRARFAEICNNNSDVPGAKALVEDAEFTSELQEKMHKVSNMMRIIVTLIPRGQFVERAGAFVDDLLGNLEAFGV